MLRNCLLLFYSEMGCPKSGSFCSELWPLEKGRLPLTLHIRDLISDLSPARILNTICHVLIRIMVFTEWTINAHDSFFRKRIASYESYDSYPIIIRVRECLITFKQDILLFSRCLQFCAAARIGMAPSRKVLSPPKSWPRTTAPHKTQMCPRGSGWMHRQQGSLV